MTHAHRLPVEKIREYDGGPGRIDDEVTPFSEYKPGVIPPGIDGYAFGSKEREEKLRKYV